MISLYLIRHAKSKKNQNPEIIGGRSNESPLCNLGYRQAQALRYRLNVEKLVFNEIHVSPAVRTLQTARITFPDCDYLFSDDLQELEQGDWTGQDRKIIHTKDILKIMDSDPWNFRSPGGESQKDVGERMNRWLDKNVIKKYDHLIEGYKIGVVGHGVAFKCLLKNIIGLNENIAWRVQLNNTSITQLDYDGKWWWPIRINDSSHIYDFM